MESGNKGGPGDFNERSEVPVPDGQKNPSYFYESERLRWIDSMIYVMNLLQYQTNMENPQHLKIFINYLITIFRVK